jgi:hypothetical protein
MLINEVGCILHRDVQWDRTEDGHSIFKCKTCEQDVDREAEDAGSGC